MSGTLLQRMQFTGTWRDYQARALEEMAGHLDDHRLHIVAAPGAGKTILGLEIVRRLGRPALVFAPSLAIRDQWRDRLVPLFMDRLPGPDDISRDLADPRTLTLATYQSLDAYRRADDLDALIAALEPHGPFTLVLDEAHHLRKAWWDCLNRLASELPDVRIVALTATPPYDASLAEWNRYEGLCGPIDLEIGIPELVRNGDLCPHQDHVLLSQPGEDALALLARRRAAIADLQLDLRGDQALLDFLAAHPWLTDPDTHIEAILEAPKMLSAALVLLGSAGRKLPAPALDVLGVSARDLPPPSQFWLERLLDGLVFTHRRQFALEEAQREALENRLHRHGLIEGGRVRLGHTRSVFRLLAASLGKIDSILHIVRAEQAALGDDLRLVVLSDHIRAGELPRSADAEFTPAKLGVIPIFESLRRAGTAPGHLAVLTGSLVILPRAVEPAMRRMAKDLGLDPAALRTKHIAACPDHVELEAGIGGSAPLVRLVTALFVSGEIRVLVGTQSLLGEGWDAPALNSLVLASNTASFMLSNQMRGRAIRVDPAAPGKVANIWHLATLEPEPEGLRDAMADRFAWGGLDNGNATGITDIGVVARRFRAFECISNGASDMIESGLGRLALDPALPLAQQNAVMLSRAADRGATADKWASSLGQGDARSQVRETVAPDYAPRGLSTADTLQSLLWVGGGSGLVAAADQLRGITSFEGLGLAAMSAAGVGTLVGLPRLYRAARLALRNGSMEKSLGEVTQVVIDALAAAGRLTAEEAARAGVEIGTSMDGRKDIVVTGLPRASERQVIGAVAEVLGPVQNPRYLLVRSSWLGPLARQDYHAVPTALGGHKRDAEGFAQLWQRHIGSSRLVFTRNREGRKMLLKARMRSFAAGFQRSVDRRSAWL